MGIYKYVILDGKGDIDGMYHKKGEAVRDLRCDDMGVYQLTRVAKKKGAK